MLPLVALLIMGCNPGGNTFRIKGRFDGMNAGELYFFCPSDPSGRIDTLTLVGGQFEYEGETEDTLPYVLLFPNALEHVIFVSPGKTIEYKAAANDMKNYMVSGTDENEQLTQFRLETSELKEKQTLDKVREYIKTNPESKVSAYLFDRYYMQKPDADYAEADKLLQQLIAGQPDNYRLMAMSGQMSSAGALRVGNKVPDALLRADGDKRRKLWDKKSDYTVIFFWATWLRNSYDFVWRVRQLQETCDANVRFVGISYDTEIYRWQEMTRRDSLQIEHYCDGLAFASAETKKFSVPELPFYVIADKSHKVIITGNDVQQLAKDVSKYVK